MNIIYVLFCITVGVTVAINFFSSSRNEKIEASSYYWMVIGVAYLIMFSFLAISGTVDFEVVFLFQVLSAIGIIMFSRALESKFMTLTLPAAIGIILFIILWTVLGYLRDMSEFSILFPSSLAITLISLLVAIYYFIRSDDEILMKNILGGLFTAFGLCKILYIMDEQTQDMSFYIGLFVLDYLVYIIITFLLLFNNNFRYQNKKNRNFYSMKEIINEAPMGYITLDRDGNIKVANKFIMNRLANNGVHKGTIYDLFDLFPVIDKFYYQIEWKRILVALDMRQRYYKSKEIYGDKKIDIEFDFHQVEVYSSNNPEILLTISHRETEISSIEHITDNDFADLITGLPSKNEMAIEFGERVKENSDESFAMILMSIANYKEMVKYLGSEMAEDFMSILNSYIEEVDQIQSIGKISSDTFELFTKNLDEQQIEEVVNDLILNLQIPFRHKEYDIETKPLLGIAIYPEDGVTHGELIRSARIALSKAELTERAQIQYSNPVYMKKMKDKSEIENALRHALENEEFHLVFQPQYDTVDRIFRGFEALVRWEKDGQKPISPNLFIPMAEELGIMNEIGMWILEEAIKKGSAWQNKYGEKFIMSVNISSFELKNKELSIRMRQILENYNYDPKFLEVEISESRLSNASREVFGELRRLKELGIKIALDDFGTGFSSLNHIRWLPFDVLKIDKSFIDYMNDDSVEREMIHSIINFVSKMNVETIAEGVENNEQLKSLKASNCNYVQGHLLSKPLVDDDVERVLAKNMG